MHCIGSLTTIVLCSMLILDGSGRTIIILAGWSITAFFAYKILTAENVSKIYNPFEILDISTVGSFTPNSLQFGVLMCVISERDGQGHQISLQEAIS